jgi:hypothetical protein
MMHETTHETVFDLPAAVTLEGAIKHADQNFWKNVRAKARGEFEAV